MWRQRDLREWPVVHRARAWPNRELRRYSQHRGRLHNGTPVFAKDLGNGALTLTGPTIGVGADTRLTPLVGPMTRLVNNIHCL
jgi:hypothetical protein